MRRLLTEGHQVVVVDDLSRGSRQNLRTTREQVTVVAQDITADFGRIVTSCRPDVIFHLAAVHYIPDCDADPARCIRVNVDGTRAVLDAGAQFDPPIPVILASSGAVYAPDEEPHHEDDRLAPIDVYGYSKRWAEELVNGYGIRAAASVGIARLFNVFGPGETNPHFIPSLISQLQAARSIRLGNLSSRRDYVFVDDVVDALVAMARYCHLGQSVTVNVGTGRSYSGHEILQALAGLPAASASPAPIIDPSRVRAVDRPVLQASNELAYKTLGWTPRTSLLAGLQAAWVRPMAAEVAF